MAQIRFLLDEHVPLLLIDAVIRAEPAIELNCVGQMGAPPKRTTDPELLRYAEEHQFALVTIDKKTMPGHVEDHWSSGRHTWGVFTLRDGFSVRRYVQEMVLIWAATEAAEWRDRMEWLPL